MIYTWLDTIDHYPFEKLRKLLSDVQPRPGAGHPIDLALGEPQGPPPEILALTLATHAAHWNRYPPRNGTASLREAIAGWLVRRYRLPKGMIDSDTQVQPVPGTRSPLFLTALMTVVGNELNVRHPEKPPVVLLPNPLFAAYYGGAVLAGAEARAVAPPLGKNQFPAFDQVDEEVLERTRLIYVCNPSNPEGCSASLDYLCMLILLARRLGAVVAFDECYSEIYDVKPPLGALEACAYLGGGLSNVLVFNSLSKRSNAPGLRSGFVAGDASWISKYISIASFGGVPCPIPVCEAAAALWNDELHVNAIRDLYRENFKVAQMLLGSVKGFYRPEGGFFLWLPMPWHAEAVARDLWRDHALKVLPGNFLSRPAADGTPLFGDRIRVALVHEPKTTELALRRMKAYLLSK